MPGWEMKPRAAVAAQSKAGPLLWSPVPGARPAEQNPRQPGKRALEDVSHWDEMFPLPQLPCEGAQALSNTEMGQPSTTRSQALSEPWWDG